MKKTFLFLAALAMSAMMMAAEKITTVAGITSGNKYYIGATNGDKDSYFYVDGSAKTESIKGVAKEDVADAVALTFTAVTDGWTIQFDNGLYLGLKNAKDNGAVQVMETPVVWTIEENTDKGLLKLHPNDYYLQKNNSGTQFGSYKNTQTDVWLESAGAAPVLATFEGIVIKGTAEKMEYEVGEAFDPAGLEVWGIYTKIMKGDSTSQIKSGITWTLDPETFAEVSENASVKLSASYKDKTSADTIISGIKVKAVVPKMDVAFDFTKNLYGHKGVSSGSGDSYVSAGDIAVGEKFNEDPAQIEFTVNGSTQTRFWDASSKHELRLYNGAQFVLSIVGDYKIIKVEFTGSAVNLEGNGVTVSDKVWEGDATKSVTFVNTATGSKINSIKVTYIAAAPAVANPTITPDTVANVYWEPITVTLACETEGAAIYYTLDGSEPTASATKYDAPFSVTATTTVKAIAMKSGLDNSEVVSKTFTFGTVFASLEELVEKQPAKDDVAYVQVTITNAEIDSFYVSSKGYTNGVFVTVASTVVELYTNDVPETWVVGGKVSGKIQAQWGLYKGVAELQKWEGGWNAFSYTAPGQTAKLESITLSLDKETLYQNEEFKYSGTVTANYDDQSTKDVTDQVTYKGYDMAVLGEQTITVSYTEGEITKEAAYTLTVAEKVAPTGYASIYTSDVELTTEGGTSAYAAKVIIGGTTYDAIKCGTSSIAGACVITIPAATKTLHFHAAGWNKESVVLNESINLVADAGVSGTSPFTLQNDPATQDYFTLDPKGATTITFTATTDKRFVLFGVNAELAEGVVAAPTFTPTESEFDKEVMVTLSAEGADIYYTLDGTTPSNASTKYEAPFKLTATTTVKAIAIKGDKSSEVAEKTYTLIPSFESLEDLVTKQPATETNVTVIVTITEASVDSFYVTSKGQKNGIYTHVGETVVELYLYDVPETWVVGGKVSGKIQAQWGLYKGTAELQQWEGGWNAFSYTDPGTPTNLQELMQDNIVRKVLVNGYLVIMKDNQLFNLQGQTL